MVRKLAIVFGLGFVLVAGGQAMAQSKCDGGVTKAKGKKVACKCGVYAKAYQKNLTPDAAKLAKCEAKFDKACTKATGAGDCVVQTKSCAANEGEADTFVNDHCVGSASGAFLN
jgi:hypothetical protein